MNILVILSFIAYMTRKTSSQGYENPACNGKQVIVHLFEWRWQDIAEECERFLKYTGFCGVQTSPPAENAVIEGDHPRPWWERYQPVSYKLETRSGTRDEFINMVHRCNAVGVRIFADVLMNHMTSRHSCCLGTGGSDFNGSAKYFPGVPYDEENFTPRELCPSQSGDVDNYQDEDNVRNCNLVGLNDLYGRSPIVQDKIADYLNDLISIGVAGFRADAAKHMWPSDIKDIIGKVNNLNTSQGFPANTKPFFYLEVIDRGNEVIKVQQYYGLGRITEFRYGERLASAIRDFSKLETVYDRQIDMTDSDKSLIFVDNHDNQRGHGGAQDHSVYTYKNPFEYRLATAFTLAQPYAFTRIMSSYYFGQNTDMGPPHFPNMNTKGVPIDENNNCYDGWVCEHRWPSIYKMVNFRNNVTGTNWNNYYSDNETCAFSRGSIGFFAMSKKGQLLKEFQTSMESGTYKELITCSDVEVYENKTIRVSIDDRNEPIFAICKDCSCTNPPVIPAAQIVDPSGGGVVILQPGVSFIYIAFILLTAVYFTNLGL